MVVVFRLQLREVINQDSLLLVGTVVQRFVLLKSVVNVKDVDS